MATRNSWEGFKPDVSPLPEIKFSGWKKPEEKSEPKKSTQEQLDEVVDQIATLEEKREELQYAAAKEEVLKDDEGTLHEACYSKDDLLEEVQREAREYVDEVWDLLREFGGHAPPCLSGALAGSQKIHPLCTCGWNEVATRLERR